MCSIWNETPTVGKAAFVTASSFLLHWKLFYSPLLSFFCSKWGRSFQGGSEESIHLDQSTAMKEEEEATTKLQSSLGRGRRKGKGKNSGLVLEIEHGREGKISYLRFF